MVNDRSIKCTVDYHEDLIESLRDIREAKAYLLVTLEEYVEEGNHCAFTLAINHLVEARGITWTQKCIEKMLKQELQPIHLNEHESRRFIELLENASVANENLRRLFERYQAKNEKE